MTTPVFNERSSDSSLFYDPADNCDPTNMSCGGSVGTSSTPAAPPAITLDPVYVTGDAGAQKLVEAYYVQTGPSCAEQAKTAALVCAKAIGAGVGTGLAAALPPAFAVMLGRTFLDGVSCGSELRALYDCEEP